MASLTLDNVSKKYGNVLGVDRISAEVKDGEFVALIGPSGCGKSSTMRMIAGLESITTGSIFIDGVQSERSTPSSTPNGDVVRKLWALPAYDYF